MSETIHFIPSRNPHSKPIEVVVCGCGCGEELLRCPTCGVPNNMLDEPHTSGNVDMDKKRAEETADWESCPWPHPQDLRDEAGDFITFIEPFRDGQDNPLPGPGIVCFKKDIDYPEDHPYWAWNEEHHKRGEKYACSGPKISDACSDWIADKDGPLLHATCDEECYCHCHTDRCICPDPDKGVETRALAIVCGIHGHVYSKMTTEGLE